MLCLLLDGLIEQITFSVTPHQLQEFFVLLIDLGPQIVKLFRTDANRQ